MSTLGLIQDLGSDIVWCPAQCSSALLVLLRHNHGCETEVPYFDIHVVVQEKVPHLQVAMGNMALMKVFNSSTELDHNPSYFWQTERLPLPDHVHNGAVGA